MIRLGLRAGCRSQPALLRRSGRDDRLGRLPRSAGGTGARRRAERHPLALSPGADLAVLGDRLLTSLGESSLAAEATAEQVIERLDTDGDDRISKTEAAEAKRGRLDDHFDKIDGNNDGFLTAVELKAFHENRKGKEKPQKI